MPNYFVDTNYILRLFLKDNIDQYDVVYDLFRKAIDHKVSLYTSIIVFFELDWVLSRVYEYHKEECIVYFEKILKMNHLNFDEKEVFTKSLALYKNTNLDLEDCYNIIYFKIKGYNHFATFDKKLLGLLKKS